MLDKIENEPLNHTPFQQACAEGNLDKCQELLADSLIMHDISSEDLTTGLVLAVQNNHVEVVKWLLEHKASIFIEKSANKQDEASISQLVDMPSDKDSLSCHTAFSFCTNAEIFALLYKSLGPSYFTQPHGLVIQCELIMSMLNTQLANTVNMWSYLNNVQSIVIQLSHYTDKSIVALNALAKTFFDYRAYQEALFCYRLIDNLIANKGYKEGASYYAKYTKNVVDYNLNVVQLKIEEINNCPSEHETYTNYFKNIGDNFTEKEHYLEAEQSYKKAILHCNVDNNALKTKLYLKLLLNYTRQLYGCSSKQKVLLVQNTSDYLNRVLEVARETPDLSKSTAWKLKTILDKLFSADEHSVIEAFCKQCIAMDITTKDALWILLEIHLVSSQVELQMPMDDDLFKNIMLKSSDIVCELTDNVKYWEFLDALYRLGCLFSENNQATYAEQCYKTVFDLSDGKRLDHNLCDFEPVYKKSGSALIKTRLELKIEITSDILDKFLAIGPLKDYSSYSLVKMMPRWKQTADLLFTNKHFVEAEYCYKKIVDLMFSTDWQSAITDYDDDYRFDRICLPIETARQLVTSQIINGFESQEVINTMFLKMKRMMQFLETDEDPYEHLVSTLLTQVNRLFNGLGDTFSSELDDRTFHMATECFLKAYEVALKNDNNNYADVNPTLQKLLTHYQSMEKQSTFITRLLAIFSPSLSSVNVKQSFHLIYVNCLNAIENANTVEMQFFMAAFNLLEKFANKSGNKSKDGRVVSWQDFFEQGNHKDKFLRLHEKLQNNLNNGVKRKSSDDLNGYILKKSKTDVLLIEGESILTEEACQNQYSIDLVPYTNHQPVLEKRPYSYSHSANGFNSFFSIQQQSERKSKYKSAHHFDFDQTLTTVHVHEWKKDPSVEECKAFLRSETIKTLRFILQSGNYVSIVTNGTAHRISWILSQAGLTQEELNKIPIKAAASPTIVPDFKPGAIRTLAEKWADVKNHYFYDDRENFCMEVWKMRQEFENKHKHLHVMYVSREPHDCSHLGYAWQKAVESSSEKEPLDTQFAL